MVYFKKIHENACFSHESSENFFIFSTLFQWQYWFPSNVGKFGLWRFPFPKTCISSPQEGSLIFQCNRNPSRFFVFLPGCHITVITLVVLVKVGISLLKTPQCLLWIFSKTWGWSGCKFGEDSSPLSKTIQLSSDPVQLYSWV